MSRFVSTKRAGIFLRRHHVAIKPSKRTFQRALLGSRQTRNRLYTWVGATNCIVSRERGLLWSLSDPSDADFWLVCRKTSGKTKRRGPGGNSGGGNSGDVYEQAVVKTVAGFSCGNSKHLLGITGSSGAIRSPLSFPSLNRLSSCECGDVDKQAKHGPAGWAARAVGEGRLWGRWG